MKQVTIEEAREEIEALAALNNLEICYRSFSGNYPVCYQGREGNFADYSVWESVCFELDDREKVSGRTWTELSFTCAIRKMGTMSIEEMDRALFEINAVKNFVTQANAVFEGVRVNVVEFSRN